MTTDSSPTLMAIFLAADAGVPLGQLSPELISVPLDQIVPCRWQPRQQFDPAALLGLANDIAQHGVLTLPLVWSNEDLEYELIAGERRIRAVYALFMHGVPHALANRKLASRIEEVAAKGFVPWREHARRIIDAGVCDTVQKQYASLPCRQVWGKPAQLHELALVDNLQRTDLSPLEEARALHDLIQEYAYTQRQLADRLGKSQTWISQRLILLNLAPAVADQVTANAVDAATAREIARLAPGIQAQTIAHLQKHGMKSKAAQGFVQKVLDLSAPEHYADAAALNSPARHLVQIALQDIPDEGARQAAIVAYAGTGNSDGKLDDPHQEGSHRYRDLLAQTGIAGVGKGRYDIEIAPLWLEHAPAAGYTCATCQLNPHRALVGEINDLVKANRESANFTDSGWPRCTPDAVTCPSYAASEAPLRLPLPRIASKFVFTPEEETVLDVSGFGKKVSDVASWAAIIRRRYAQQKAIEEQKQDCAANGLARALAHYLTLQRSGELVPNHVHHQPCNLCAFHKVDADDTAEHCHFQAQPSDWNDWDTAVIRLWESGHTTIGRCRLFRLKQPELNLPDLPGAGIGLPPDGLLHLLHQVSSRDTYQGSDRWGPRWFDCKRTKAQDAPSWSHCKPALTRLIPQLSPGRQLALVMLWDDPFSWGSVGFDKRTIETNAYVPRLGDTAPFTLKETIVRA